jgi:hypothetical protein
MSHKCQLTNDSSWNLIDIKLTIGTLSHNFTQDDSYITNTCMKYVNIIHLTLTHNNKQQILSMDIRINGNNTHIYNT